MAEENTPTFTNYNIPDWLKKAAPSIFSTTSDASGEGVAVPTKVVQAVPALAAAAPLSEPEKQEAMATGQAKTDAAQQLADGTIEHPGSEGNTAASADAEQGDVFSILARSAALPRAYGVGGRIAAVSPEASNYLTLGGPEGEKLFKETFSDRPEKMMEAILAGGEAQAKESSSMEEAYKNEIARSQEASARIQEQYQLRQQEQQARLQEIEKQTSFYTNNLADSGAFWKKPQNIFAAFSAALTHLGTDDHKFGYNLINNAIQQDLHNRQELAKMHLGNLRSNLTEYDRIAGDKISGMLLAESEAKRVAAMQIEQIAQRFRGEKAKANASTIVQKLWMDVNNLRMQVYRTSVFNPAHLEDPRVLASRIKTGKATGGVGFTPYGTTPGGAAGVSSPSIPGVSATTGARGGGQPALAGMSYGAPAAKGEKSATSDVAYLSNGRPIRITPFMSESDSAAIDARYPGVSNRIKAIRKFRTEQIAAASLDEKDFNKNMVIYDRFVQEQSGKMTAQLAEKAGKEVSAYSRLGQDIRNVESELNALKKYGVNITPQEWMGTAHAVAPETMAKIRNLNSVLEGIKDPAERNKFEAHANNLRKASDRFHQLLAGNVNGYYKSLGGSAITKNELPRLEEYISAGSSWDQIKNFVANESQQLGHLTSTIKAGGDELAAALFDLRVGQDFPGLATRGISVPDEGSRGGPQVPRPGSKGKPRSKEELPDKPSVPGGLNLLQRAVETLKKRG